jgi:hypothetical protein
MATSSSKLYQQVVRITYVYLGPAADRFVTRQIVNHLQKQPEQLAVEDLPALLDWIKLAMSFLTDDQQLVDSYIKRLRSLEAKSTVKPTSTATTTKTKAGPHAIEAA